MECVVCGKTFRPSGRGRKQKYCSESCKNHAKYEARKQRARNGEASKSSQKPRPAPAVPKLDRKEFERMMDGSTEDALREVRERLKIALHADDTPASTLAPIGRMYIEVSERLEGLAGGDPLDGLLDDDAEVSADAGAALV